jgi:hypothetical protein
VTTTRTTYRLRTWARCPVDDSVDVYDVEIEAEFLQVERILDAVAKYGAGEDSDEGWFQEDLTRDLAHALSAKVTTVGIHSGVETVCVSEPDEESA